MSIFSKTNLDERNNRWTIRTSGVRVFLLRSRNAQKRIGSLKEVDIFLSPSARCHTLAKAAKCLLWQQAESVLNALNSDHI